jgi:hypothetical protein
VSKFLLNLLVQISKALVYSKIHFLSEKNFSSTFGPIGPVASHPIHPFWPRAAKQAEPAHQAMAPFPFLSPSSSRRHRCLLLSRRHAMGATLPLSHTMERPQWTLPLLNSVACLYSVVNPPPPFTACNRCLHGQPLKLPPASPPPFGPYKRETPSPIPCRTRPHSPPLLFELELHHLQAPLPPPICRCCLAVTPPNEPG